MITANLKPLQQREGKLQNLLKWGESNSEQENTKRTKQKLMKVEALFIFLISQNLFLDR